MGGGGEARVDDPFAGGGASDGVGEGVGGGVFDDEPGGLAVEGALEVAGASVGGDDEASDGRMRLVQLAGDGQAVAVGHFDVEHRHVDVVGCGGGEHLLAGAGLGDYLDVAVAAQ